jgi:hypothetical protein
MGATKTAAALAATAALALGLIASPAPAASPAKSAYGPVTYPMAPTGDSDFWTCVGFRRTAGAAVEDHFHCTVADQTFTGTFSESNPWPCGCTGWFSDYDGQEATRYVVRVSSNGTVVGNAVY